MSAPAKAMYSRGCAVLVILALAVFGFVASHGADLMSAVLEALGKVILLGFSIFLLVGWVARNLEDGWKNDHH